MKRAAAVLFLSFLALAPATIAFSASPSDLWLEEVARKLEAKLLDVEKQIERYGGTEEKADRKAEEARAKGSPSEATFRQAAGNARSAKEKAERVKETIVKDLSSVRRLRASFASGSDAELSKCAATYGQLEQDREVVRRYGKEIEKAQAELAEWTEKNKAALWEAAKAGVELVAGSAAEAVEQRMKRATQLRDGIRNMEGQLIAKYGQGNFNKLVSKLEVTSRSYNPAAGTIRRLDLLKYPGAVADGITYYDQITNAVTLAAQQVADGDRHLAEAMADPEFASILNQEFPGVDLATFSVEEAAKFLLKRAGMSAMPVTYADFAVKSLVIGTDLYNSRQRILQQIEIADQQLKAVEALGKQQQRSMEAFKKCRDEILAREGIAY